MGGDKTVRLIGDARATELYAKPIVDEAYAQGIAEIVHKYCAALSDRATPKIEFTDRNTLHKHGTAWKSGRITLNKRGETWGTLAHEIAHLGNGRMHDARYQEIHLEVLDLMEAMV